MFDIFRHELDVTGVLNGYFVVFKVNYLKSLNMALFDNFSLSLYTMIDKKEKKYEKDFLFFFYNISYIFT